MSNIKINNLWSTPIVEIDTKLDKEFNNILLKELLTCTPSDNFDVWKYDMPALNYFKSYFMEVVNSEIKPRILEELDRDLILSRGWINTQEPGEHLPLHGHGGSLMTAVYYIKVPSNSGDLLLTDPRGGVNWGYSREGKHDGIKYTRIIPEEGKLLIFPAYVLHSVETNNSDTYRISLATNLD